MLSKINISIAKLILCFSIILVSFYSYLYRNPWYEGTQVNTVTIRPTKITTKSTVISDDDDSFAYVNELMKPSKKRKVEDRIKWFVPTLKKSKILESTAKTRDCHNKIARFFNQGNDTSPRCKVRFFMTWISPNKLFGKRELLSLESIFKSHPEGCVVILSKSMDSDPGSEILEPLISRGYRVLAVPPDFHLLFSNTPAKGWLDRLESGLVDPGIIPITQNLSNLLRLVALYKYGGVYIDTDVIILKDFSSLRNSVGIQTMENYVTKEHKNLNNAVLVFDEGHPILLKSMDEFANTFNGNKWGHNGPALLTRVILWQKPAEIIDVNVLPVVAFYPVDWFEIADYFRKLGGQNGTDWAQDQFKRLDSSTYAIHLWNQATRGLTVENGSIMGKLFSDHCIICQNIYTTV